MAKIEKTFTYNIPDDYLAQTNSLEKTGTWTYNGPETIYAFFRKSDGKYDGRYLTSENDGAAYPTPLDQWKVEINAEENPLLCCILGADEIPDYAELPQVEEELPDGSVYRRPAVIPPDHAYELSEIVYNGSTFVEPYPWKKPHVSWEDIRAWRNGLLKLSDDRALPDMPAGVLEMWENYRQALRDLPQTYGAAPGETPSIDPWKVQPPPSPDDK